MCSDDSEMNIWKTCLQLDQESYTGTYVVRVHFMTCLIDVTYRNQEKTQHWSLRNTSPREEDFYWPSSAQNTDLPAGFSCDSFDDCSSLTFLEMWQLKSVDIWRSQLDPLWFGFWMEKLNTGKMFSHLHIQTLTINVPTSDMKLCESDLWPFLVWSLKSWVYL